MKCLILLTIFVLNVFQGVVTTKCQRRVCNQRLYQGPYFLRRFDAVKKYCTHLIIHCAQVTDQQEIYFNIHKTSKEVQDIGNLKKEIRDLKTILAVQNLQIFANFLKMYTTDNLKRKFISNIIKYVRANNIDGVKIDVQTEEGGDKQKFTQLFKDLLDAFIAEAAASSKPRLILSAGIPSNKEFLDKYYDVPAIANVVDMVDLATYNFHVLGINVTNPTHHSPLYSEDPRSTKTIDYMARYLAGKGVKKDKMNIGLALMSVAYRGNSKTGKYYSHNNTQPYYYSCDVFSDDAIHYRIEPEKGRMVEYHYSKTGGFFYLRHYFDDPESLREKVKYVKANHYGGVLLHSVTDDDLNAVCKRGPYPLSKTIYEECSTD
ncbi:hypothetical protein Btru_074476 [Bulinus truncatus]|nr:hypothetical protein Btru_074476 [Bulinus truncatus]